MMYENTRAGILDEFTDKLCDEARAGSGYGGSDELRKNRDRMQKHFIRGLVCDLIDRVSEDADRFKAPEFVSGEELLDELGIDMEETLNNLADFVEEQTK